MEIVKLALSKEELIAIDSDEELNDLVLWGSYIKVYFESLGGKMLLFHDFPGLGLPGCYEALKKSVSKRLECDYLDRYDIGFLWNDYCREEPSFVLDKNHLGGIDSFLMFETTGDYTVTTWLYQNKKSEIIFEITPDYPWTYREPEPDEEFVEYEEWMKNYKPLVKRILSKETVQQWLQQVEDLHEKVKANNERLRCKGPGCEECKKEKLGGKSQSS